MEKVTGIGGIFFKGKDQATLKEWYTKNLGVEYDDESAAVFRWQEKESHKPGSTVWSIFPQETKYFGDPSQSFMINYRVKDLDKMLEQLRKAGAKVDEKIEDSEFGRFGWVVDPDGNRIELWQPPEGH